MSDPTADTNQPDIPSTAPWEAPTLPPRPPADLADAETEAETAYDQANKLLDKLTAEFPSDPTYEATLVDNANKLGMLLRTVGRPQQAEETHRRALARAERLA